jgi:pimeloyl-ACP methyl ester carboxylesterase
MLMRFVALCLGFIVTASGCSGTPDSHTGKHVAPSGRVAADRQASAESPAEEPQRRLVSVDGVLLSILEAGTGDPVIFVHGVVTTSNIFRSYVGAYSPDYRGVAVDLRGYGDSDKPESGFDIDQFAKDLIGLADRLGFVKPVWVGVSMGGMIVQRLALDYPTRFRALVLVSTTDGPMILDKDIDTIGAPRDYRTVSKRIILDSFPPGTEPALHQPLVSKIPTWNATVLREALRSMSQFDVHSRLSQIDVPTLVMVGAKDDVATVAIAKGIVKEMRGAQLAEFNTGHFIMAEDPQAFGAVLGKFLRSLKS